MREHSHLDLSRVRDRKDKWGMQILLPEHREAINQLRRDDMKTAKPELDRYDWEILEEELAMAIREKSYVTIKSWLDGHIYEDAGVIDEISSTNRTLYLRSDVEVKKIPLQRIFGLINHY